MGFSGNGFMVGGLNFGCNFGLNGNPWRMVNTCTESMENGWGIYD